MKKKKIYFAQKAIVLKKEKEKVLMLLIKYKEAPHQNAITVKGKYSCPGGRIEFGEELDEALIREVKEETGIVIEPKDPIGLMSWQVEKPDEISQIIAVFRICKFLGGNLTNEVDEHETIIGKSEWVDIKTFNFKENIIKDQYPIIKKFINSKL